MGNAINQSSRAMWLMLRNDGGWWCIAELTRFWHPTFVEMEVADILEGLVKGLFVERQPRLGGAVVYSVTANCTPLPGYSLSGHRLPGQQQKETA